MLISIRSYFILLCMLAFVGCHLKSAPPKVPTNNRKVTDKTEVLIYSGIGTWVSEVRSIEEVLFAHGSTYAEIDAPGLDEISLEELKTYRLLIIPGGDATVVTDSLSSETHTKLRTAVQVHGLNYLGFCSGAWLAVAPAPLPGEDVSYGIGLVDGPLLTENYLAQKGLKNGLSNAIFPDGSRRNLLWSGGPITPDGPGRVIVKYEDGTPAISQIWSGKGLVIVSGLHPAVSKAVLLNLNLPNKEALAPDFAWILLDAAIRQKPLRSF